MTAKPANGFTLVELMVVVAIIAILAAVALPIYQTHVVRSRIAEALVLADGLKGVVAGNVAQGAPDLAVGAVLTKASDNSPNVASSSIDKDSGTITLVTTQRAGNGDLVLTPYGEAGSSISPGTVLPGILVWRCTSATIAQRYLPQICASSAGP